MFQKVHLGSLPAPFPAKSWKETERRSKEQMNKYSRATTPNNLRVVIHGDDDAGDDVVLLEDEASEAIMDKSIGSPMIGGKCLVT